MLFLQHKLQLLLVDVVSTCLDSELYLPSLKNGTEKNKWKRTSALKKSRLPLDDKEST